MTDWKRKTINPKTLINKWWPNADVSHIKYNPDMKSKDREYWRIEQSGGDGTEVFTINMLKKALIPVVFSSSYYKETAPDDLDSVKSIKYEIGPMKMAVVHGRIELKCGGKFPGQRERVRFPVKCEYVY